MNLNRILKIVLFIVVAYILLFVSNMLTEIIIKPFLTDITVIKQPELNYEKLSPIAPITPPFDIQLQEVADGVNKDCPKMVDKLTRLDSASAYGITRTFTYYYSLVGMDKSAINAKAVKKSMEPSMVKMVRDNPQMKWFKDNNVTLNYVYKGKSAEILFQISITPEKYNQ